MPDLPAEFGADRSAAAANEHRLAGNCGLDQRPVEFDLVAPEEIVDGHFADRPHANATGYHVVELRQRLEAFTREFTHVHDATHLGVTRGRNGDDDGIDVVVLDQLR